MLLFRVYVLGQAIVVCSGLLFLIAAFAGSLVPVPSHTLYFVTLFTALAVYGISVYSKVGFAFSTEWLTRAMQLASLHYVMYCLSGVVVVPMIGMVVPLIIYSVLDLAGMVLANPGGLLAARLTGLAQQISASREKYCQIAAQMEIFQAAFLLASVFFMGTSIFTVMIYWQFVGMRYTFSAVHRMLLSSYDGIISGVVARLGPVAWAYDKLKGLLAKFCAPQVQYVQQQSGQQ